MGHCLRALKRQARALATYLSWYRVLPAHAAICFLLNLGTDTEQWLEAPGSLAGGSQALANHSLAVWLGSTLPSAGLSPHLYTLWEASPVGSLLEVKGELETKAGWEFPGPPQGKADKNSILPHAKGCLGQ